MLSKFYTIDQASKEIEKAIMGKARFVPKDKDKVEEVLIRVMVDSILVGFSEGVRTAKDDTLKVRRKNSK